MRSAEQKPEFSALFAKSARLNWAAAALGSAIPGNASTAAAKLASPGGQSGYIARHMVEVDVEASARALATLKEMNIAVAPAARADYLLVELDGAQLGMLQREGIAHTVLRRFVLAQGAAALRANSSGSASGTNLANLNIPDNGVGVSNVIQSTPDLGPCLTQASVCPLAYHWGAVYTTGLRGGGREAYDRARHRANAARRAAVSNRAGRCPRWGVGKELERRRGRATAHT